jgi:hypothetical protein
MPIFMENWGWGWEYYQDTFLAKEDDLANKLAQGEYKNVDYAIFDYDPVLKFCFHLSIFCIHYIQKKSQILL